MVVVLCVVTWGDIAVVVGDLCISMCRYAYVSWIVVDIKLVKRICVWIWIRIVACC